MENKYMFYVKCEDLDELKTYSNAVDNSAKLFDIYNIARNYDKYIDYSEENYDKLIEEIKDLSYNE